MIRRSGPRRPPAKPRFDLTANHQIRFDQLRIITDRGEPLGVMSKDEALERAQAEHKDLVLVTDKATPPVAKIIELSKYKYQLSQKKTDERKKNRAQDIKEIRLRPFVDANDLQVKIRKAREFIKRGHKVRLCMELRGRAITKQDLANQILDQFVTEMSDVAQVENERKLIGKRIQLQLMPSKKKAKVKISEGDQPAAATSAVATAVS